MFVMGVDSGVTSMGSNRVNKGELGRFWVNFTHHNFTLWVGLLLLLSYIIYSVNYIPVVI